MWEKTKKFFKENYKFFIALIIIIVVFQYELPYKVYAPGGMVDLSQRVKVEDGFSSEGELGMAYVTMIRGSLPFLALSYIIPDWDIIPMDELTLENESFEDRFKADQIATQQSIDSAIIASFSLAGKSITIQKEVPHVTYIDEHAKTDIKLFDIILSVDGQNIKDMQELRNIVETHQEKDKISIRVERNGTEVDTEAEVFLMEGVPKIGVSITVTYEYDETPNANIEMKSSESGPSGGLMMSLALYNSLVEEDITKGKKVVGTGTISIDGTVGEIGGVRYKLIGAVEKKADVFLVPEANYEEALEVKKEKGYDIRLISVSTLEEAVAELKKI